MLIVRLIGNSAKMARMLSGGMCLTNAPSSNNATNATPMMKIRLKFRKLDYAILRSKNVTFFDAFKKLRLKLNA